MLFARLVFGLLSALSFCPNVSWILLRNLETTCMQSGYSKRKQFLLQIFTGKTKDIHGSAATYGVNLRASKPKKALPPHSFAATSLHAFFHARPHSYVIPRCSSEEKKPTCKSNSTFVWEPFAQPSAGGPKTSAFIPTLYTGCCVTTRKTLGSCCWS